MEAFKKVKENRGSAGIDQQSIRDFEKDLKKKVGMISLIMNAHSKSLKSDHRYAPAPQLRR